MTRQSVRLVAAQTAGWVPRGDEEEATRSVGEEAPERRAVFEFSGGGVRGRRGLRAKGAGAGGGGK